MNKTVENLKVHFIGVGGSGTSVLCKYLLNKNFMVSGSDKIENQTVRNLIDLGLKFYQGHNHNAVENADVIVYSSAISSVNPELVLARHLKKAIYRRSELLEIILKLHKNSIGISGTHGKTTSSFMLSEILKVAKIDCNRFIGGEYKVCEFKNSNVAVAEVCEFDRNIDFITVDCPVCLNVDLDHLDTYGSLEKLTDTFINFLNRGKVKFINLDDKILKTINANAVTFSIDSDSDFRAVEVLEEDGYYSFKVLERGFISPRIYLGVSGLHNVYNALSAIAVARTVFGVQYSYIINALCNYLGAKRRFEDIGIFHGKKVVCDYAHHPTELKASITSAKQVFKNDCLLVFQPHTYSRTKNLISEFKTALKGENLVLFKEYPSREEYDYLGSSERLAKEINSIYVDNFSDLVKVIDDSSAKTVLVLGAGDIYDIFLKEIKNG